MPMNSESGDLGETVDVPTSGGVKVTVTWNAPLTSDGLKYKNISGFELKHSFNGGFESIVTNGEDQSFVFENMATKTIRLGSAFLASIWFTARNHVQKKRDQLS